VGVASLAGKTGLPQKKETNPKGETGEYYVPLYALVTTIFPNHPGRKKPMGKTGGGKISPTC